jgi:hypothetical protein
MESKNYECKRCFYECKQLNDMKKHLNKKIKCIRAVESFKYNDNELYNNSLIKNIIIDEIRYKCNNCDKKFTTSSNLARHIDNDKCLHRNKKNIDIINDDSKDNSPKIIENNINIENITINIDNSITNNFNFNTNEINSFDDKWNTSHIDNNKKLILLLNNAKFTTTLENILENNINLNVLIDNTTDNALVYNDKKIINMSIKEIVKKTMEKLLDHLKVFKTDILDPNYFNIDKNIIEDQLKIAQNKYRDFYRDNDVQQFVNVCIKDIYNKKKDDTINKYIIINKLGY